jgi:hypothetical protein
MHHLITSQRLPRRKPRSRSDINPASPRDEWKRCPSWSRDSTLLNPATRPNSCRAAGDQITAIDAIWGDVGFPALRHRQASRSRHHRTTRQAPRRCSSSLLRLGERPHARRRCVRDRCYYSSHPCAVAKSHWTSATSRRPSLFMVKSSSDSNRFQAFVEPACLPASVAGDS